MSKLRRQDCWLKYSKSLHHVGKFRVVKKREGSKELRMVIARPWWSQESPHEDWNALTDTHVKDVFVWLGRYLALKGKLPRNHTIEEIAVSSQRTSKALRELNACEIFAHHPSGIELEQASPTQPSDAKQEENDGTI